MRGTVNDNTSVQHHVSVVPVLTQAKLSEAVHVSEVIRDGAIATKLRRAGPAGTLGGITVLLLVRTRHGKPKMGEYMVPDSRSNKSSENPHESKSQRYLRYCADTSLCFHFQGINAYRQGTRGSP